MKNGVQLITYVDRLGQSDLAGLRALLRGQFPNVFAGVHLLPFFNSIHGADAGFDPVDHLAVDPTLGSWGDVLALSQDLPVMADVIVNHVSSSSAQFQDFLAHGEASAHARLFLSLDRVFPQGATEQDLLAIYRPRPGLPFTAVNAADNKRLVWTTFTPQQIDIDVQSPAGRSYLHDILHTLAGAGVSMIRLDAVGYAIKKPGTSCFMLPETFDFIAAFTRTARECGLEVLVEVHAYYRKQMQIAAQVDWVYDFALPPLLLHAFAKGTAQRLAHWLDVRPRNALTVLDTHDGIGIIDIGGAGTGAERQPGLVPDEELDDLVEWIHGNCNGQSREATGAAASNLDLYQVNCTFFDALGRDERRYLAARAVQFFLPGVPQVYYVGLLAGSNDMDLLRRTRVGRDINRSYYSAEQVREAAARPVVKALLALIALRNQHPAFGGEFGYSLLPDSGSNAGPSPALCMHWQSGDDARAELSVDFATNTCQLKISHTAELPAMEPLAQYLSIVVV